MARRSALFAVLLLAPSFAVAQATPGAGAITVTESADPSEVNPPYINIAECNGTTADTLTYYWNPSLPGASYDIWIADQPTSTSSTCPPTSSSTVTVQSRKIDTVQSGTTNKTDDQTVQTRLSQLSVSCTGNVTTVYLCMNVGGQTDQIAATGSLKLDLGVPSTPTSVNVVPGDTVLHVSWAAGSGGTGTTTGYRVFWGPHNGELSSSHDLTGSGTTSYDIGGLANNTDYDVQVSALSVGKNESDRSEIVPGTPIPVLDFWRLYKSDGGQEQGGCAGGAAGLVALLALLPLALRRRRS
jgi:Synergist-CTERM protein sorting domain-containing protein